MSEMEMKDEVETEEFTDELSDEALDRKEEGRFFSAGTVFTGWASSRAGG